MANFSTEMNEQEIKLVEDFMRENEQQIKDIHFQFIPISHIKSGINSIKKREHGILVWYWSYRFRHLAFYISHANEIISIEFKLNQIIAFHNLNIILDNTPMLK
jgi:hypothetical protein